jgi:hypothetical protein
LAISLPDVDDLKNRFLKFYQETGKLKEIQEIQSSGLTFRRRRKKE